MQDSNDPLKASSLRGPGLWETLRSLINPLKKKFDVLQIEVSTNCVANCIYCPRSSRLNIWKNEHMEPQTFANAWPLFRQAQRVHLQGWGEPLMHKRFFDFVALARRADCQVSTTSCGLIMNDDVALRLVNSGLDVIAFSLAGVNAKGNVSRGVGSFDKVVEAIKALQKVRKERMAVHLEVHLAYMVLASQIEDMRGLPDLLDELDVHAAVVSTMDFIPSMDLADEAFMPWEQDKIAHARTVLEEISAEASARGRDIFYSLPVPEPRCTCLEHIESCLYIASSGAVSPCIYVNLPTTVLDPMRRIYGNVNEGAPLEIWDNPEYEGFRKGLLEFKPDENCVDCPKRYAVGNRE